jgi:hypothetical protein
VLMLLLLLSLLLYPLSSLPSSCFQKHPRVTFGTGKCFITDDVMLYHSGCKNAPTVILEINMLTAKSNYATKNCSECTFVGAILFLVQ